MEFIRITRFNPLKFCLFSNLTVRIESVRVAFATSIKIIKTHLVHFFINYKRFLLGKCISFNTFGYFSNCFDRIFIRYQEVLTWLT
jgi:hypothetical protein